MYSWLRPLLFSLPPESAHHLAMTGLRLAHDLKLGRLLPDVSSCREQQLKKEVFGLWFDNPVGLAAGFDKNADSLDALAGLGFGFIEIGTVTPRPQIGNPKPRLFRLPKDQGLINRMGFNNKGLDHVCARLQDFSRRPHTVIVGGNIGKNKDTPNALAPQDYVQGFKALAPYVDYLVVNISSPNTPGLRDLFEEGPLKELLSHLQGLRRDLKGPHRPMLLKLSPDLAPRALPRICELCVEHGVDGLIASNTTLSRDTLRTSASESDRMGAGGLSGAPLFQKTLERIQELSRITKGHLPLIASGGIFSGQQARQAIEAGASLVQVWTGLVYQGPQLPAVICRELLRI